MQKKTHILVTGQSGQLGHEIQDLSQYYPDNEFTFTTRTQLDLSKPESIINFFNGKSYDIIINCAAHTAVDKAETEAELADSINHLSVEQLANIANQNNCKLIHVSTDYVFDGTKHYPYIETDKTNPQGVYGHTKLKGELAIQKNMPENALIIRTSWVYSSYGNNFVKTMLRLGQERDQLGIIFDQIGSPTYAKDLAKAILHITQQKSFKYGRFDTAICHFSNEGVASWYDFAKAIFELNNIDCKVIPIETKDYPTPASRPHYSVLNKAKIKQSYNLTIPYWKDSLQQCLKALKEDK